MFFVLPFHFDGLDILHQRLQLGDGRTSLDPAGRWQVLLHLGRTFAQHFDRRPVTLELLADDLVGVGRVVEDDPVLLGVGRERRRQLLGRDAVPFGAELMAELEKSDHKKNYLK